MIDTNYLNVQRLSQQPKKNDVGFLTFFKIVAPYILAGFVFESLSKQCILSSPETVAWVASKTFEAMKWTATVAGVAHSFWVYSPYSRTPKIVLYQKEIEALRAENIHLRQELAARQTFVVSWIKKQK